MPRTIDNNGIGALFGMFFAPETPILRGSDTGKGVMITGNNTVGFPVKSTYGRLLGRLEHVGPDGHVTVQISGVARFPNKNAKLGGKVVLNSDGSVGDGNELEDGSGHVLAVYLEQQTCDVLLP